MHGNNANIIYSQLVNEQASNKEKRDAKDCVTLINTSLNSKLKLEPPMSRVNLPIVPSKSIHVSSSHVPHLLYIFSIPLYILKSFKFN